MKDPDRSYDPADADEPQGSHRMQTADWNPEFSENLGELRASQWREACAEEAYLWWDGEPEDGQHLREMLRSMTDTRARQLLEQGAKPTMPKPTIHELEAILDEPDGEVTLLPDGSVKVLGEAIRSASVDHPNVSIGLTKIAPDDLRIRELERDNSAMKTGLSLVLENFDAMERKRDEAKDKLAAALEAIVKAPCLRGFRSPIVDDGTGMCDRCDCWKDAADLAQRAIADDTKENDALIRTGDQIAALKQSRDDWRRVAGDRGIQNGGKNAKIGQLERKLAAALEAYNLLSVADSPDAHDDAMRELGAVFADDTKEQPG